jgi:hypothetical protein
MSTYSKIYDRFREFPRVTQWVIIFGGAIVLFLIWDSTLGALTRDLNTKAMKVTNAVEDVRDGSRVASRLRNASMKDTIVALGQVETPGEERTGRQTLTYVVNDVLARFDCSDDTFNLRSGGDNLPRRYSDDILGPGRRIRRLSGEVKFSASPENAIAIISEFERHPDIEGVPDVRITKGDGRNLDVRLQLEVWVRRGSTRS